MDISAFTVPTCPPAVCYIPNFITSHEEAAILSAVQTAPKPKWEQLSNRRLMNYGGVPHPKGMLAEPMPAWLQPYVEMVNSLGVFDKHPANHVLINEYLPGQGIMPHTDGPLFHPIISTISCGSHTVLEFTEAPALLTTSSDSAATRDQLTGTAPKPQRSASGAAFKLLVEPRSLLVLQENVYDRFMHSIAERDSDLITDDILNLQQCCVQRSLGARVQREKRISLTIRHVPKTSKLKLQLGRR